MAYSVLFDLDGTIVFSHPIHYKAYEQILKDFGVGWEYNEFCDIFAGTGAPAIFQKLMARHSITEFDLDALVTRKKDLFNELLESEKIPTVPGFEDFLADLKLAQVKRAIASGSHTDNIHAILKNLQLTEDFPHIVGGNNIVRHKPAPDSFLVAANKLEVHPRDCLVIEDTDVGVLAAKAAGMKCVALLTTSSPERLQRAGADWIAKDYQDVRKIYNHLSHEKDSY